MANSDTVGCIISSVIQPAPAIHGLLVGLLTKTRPLLNGKAKMKHLKENNETYIEHMKHAMGISFLLLTAGTKCLIHSIVPPLFETGVSSKLDDIIALVKRNETPT